VWMGLYPSPFLLRIETSVRHIVARVSPEYEAKYAADCDTRPPTPEAIAASSNPAARFLAAMPCDVNGNPLPGEGTGQGAGQAGQGAEPGSRQPGEPGKPPETMPPGKPPETMPPGKQ
jgi:hypothetical protein